MKRKTWPRRRSAGIAMLVGILWGEDQWRLQREARARMPNGLGGRMSFYSGAAHRRFRTAKTLNGSSLGSITGKILRCSLNQAQEVSNHWGGVAAARREVQNRLGRVGTLKTTIHDTVHVHSRKRSRNQTNP